MPQLSFLGHCCANFRAPREDGALFELLPQGLIGGNGPGTVSEGIEEVAPDDWIAKVYDPDIAGKWSSLTKPPAYGSGPRAREES